VNNKTAVKHLGIFLSNKTNKSKLIQALVKGQEFTNYINITGLKGYVFGQSTLNKMVDEELRHDKIIIATAANRGLHTMSNGQQKQALLMHILDLYPDYIIIDDLASNIDVPTLKTLTQDLQLIANKTSIIQLFSRQTDVLPFIDQVIEYDLANEYQQLSKTEENPFVNLKLPQADTLLHTIPNPLIDLQHIHAHYGDKKVLNDISWQINRGESWQLKGANGSGKSTLLQLIIGDNPRGFGQDMFLFGRKKGSGESIWDIKKNIGYFTPAMLHNFHRNDSVLNMIISGINDTIGLYTQPTDMQKDLAATWIEILGVGCQNTNFQSLSIGQQRMVMVARAMVKHPPLLILDEPTIELDEKNARLFVALVNAIAAEQKVAIIYVSHRTEPALNIEKVFELIPSIEGSMGKILLP